MSRIILAITLSSAIATPAFAQLPTRIVPNYGGGYTIQHSNPTEFPTQVRPDGMGGVIADQLGHQPTYINPDRSTGGYTIDAPFHNQVVPNAELDDNDER